MTLNLRNNFQQKTTINQSKAAFLHKNKITVNEVVQTHFTAEGVQAYSPQQIAALKIRQQKKSNALSGQFIGLQIYKIDDQIQFTEKPVVNSQSKIKPKKGQKAKLESVKEHPSESRKIIKPSIRNQMGRTNRNLNKIDKNLQKKQDYQLKYAQLAKKYKEHFGQDEKPNKIKNKKQIKLQEEEGHEEVNQISINDQENQNSKNEVELEQEQGDQFVPSFTKKLQKSMKTMAKTGKNKQEDEQRDSNFEQVQLQQVKSKKSNLSATSSRLKASTYSQKLGNAIHFLFD